MNEKSGSRVYEWSAHKGSGGFNQCMRTKATRQVDPEVEFQFLLLFCVGNASPGYLCELCAVKRQNFDRLLVQVPLVVIAMVGHCLQGGEDLNRSCGRRLIGCASGKFSVKPHGK